MSLRSIKKTIAGLILSVLLLAGFFNVSPARAAGASLYLTPSTGTYVLGDKFTVAVKAFPGGSVINAAEGLINFDKTYLEVVSISKSGSIFGIWTTEPSYSNSVGTISFGGGLTPPGFSGQSGKIISVTFRAKSVGVGQVRFSSGAVLANDGKGSNVLETMGSGNFTIAAKEDGPKDAGLKPTDVFAPILSKKQPQIEPITEQGDLGTVDEEYNKPEVSSPSHPDQNTWYSNNNVELKWELPAEVTGISFDFNRELTTELRDKPDGLFASKVYTNVENGAWYFHIKYYDGKQWGTTERFRVLVDHTRPLPFSIQVAQKDSGSWPTLSFKALDDLSGVQTYEVFVNSLDEERYNLPEDDSKEVINVELSQLEYGEHTALVKVLDKAGNETDSTVKFTIQPIETPIVKSYAREIKSSDQFYLSGTSLEDVIINIYIQDDQGKLISKTTKSDQSGNWFYLYEDGLKNGRYIAWVEAENENGLKSQPSEKLSFLVSPPVFATVGTFVINYFTVIASLLFMVILIIISLLYLANMIRKKLKKETVEVEVVLHQNMVSLKKLVEDEMGKLNSIKRATDIKKEGAKMREMLNETIATTEKKILSEIKDVENILK